MSLNTVVTTFQNDSVQNLCKDYFYVHFKSVLLDLSLLHSKVHLIINNNSRQTFYNTHKNPHKDRGFN
ncbi:hypothetical protein BATMR_06470 [Bacillus altitudinis]|nr:hypothetical protein BATMR_06470 [Bacillus altitudinis]